jgi:hypothetical protein
MDIAYSVERLKALEDDLFKILQQHSSLSRDLEVENSRFFQSAQIVVSLVLQGTFSTTQSFTLRSASREIFHDEDFHFDFW